MSCLNSIYTGATGIQINERNLQIIGDNLSNLNTDGYKRKRASFHELLGGIIHGHAGSKEAGVGVGVLNTETDFSIGSLKETNINSDMAIKGQGFFMVKGTADGYQGAYYTRVGNFHIDKDGFMVDANRLKLQGFNLDKDGKVVGGLDNINISNNSQSGRASSEVKIAANLDATTAAKTSIPDAAAMENNPAQKSSFASTVTVYDSRGQAQELEIHFSKLSGSGAAGRIGTSAHADSVSSWNYQVLAKQSKVDTTPAPVDSSKLYVQIAGGTLDFDKNGNLVKQDKGTGTRNTGAVHFKGADNSQIINFDFASGGGITSYASTNAIIKTTQDGFKASEMKSFRVTSQGYISGLFSDGEERNIGKVMLAKFQNTRGLKANNGNLYSSTVDSGAPIINEAGSGGTGLIQGGALEMSNVDLTKEFVDMIKTQRSFQAASKVVMTSDRMLMQLFNIKR